MSEVKRGWQLWDKALEERINKKMTLPKLTRFMVMYNPLWTQWTGDTQESLERSFPELKEKIYKYAHANPYIGDGLYLRGAPPDNFQWYWALEYSEEGNTTSAIARVLHTAGSMSKYESMMNGLLKILEA